MTGVILFRAQPFHNGHLYMIKKAYQDVRKIGSDLHIFIGSADKDGTVRNPLPIPIRIDLVIGSLTEHFSENELKNIHVWPLEDLQDEANNTYSWGNYLYDKIVKKTKDVDIMFFYSDKPEIILSWFNPDLLNYICFKFIKRFEGLSATDVRKCIENDDETSRKVLKNSLPSYVFQHLSTVRHYIMISKK